MDADGDTDTATLTLSLTGADDGVSITDLTPASRDSALIELSKRIENTVKFPLKREFNF